MIDSVREPVETLYPVHQAIFNSNLRLLSKLLKQEIEGVFFTHKNAIDQCGNTPLMLAVKLGNVDAVKILSDLYTCPKMRPLPALMNAKEIAIAMKHQVIIKIIMSSNQKIKQQFFEENKQAIFKVLEQLPDFKVDLNLTCDSNWFPVFSSVAPSDTYKIFKQGSNLRLDMTLLGLQKFNLIKGNITVLYKGRNSSKEQQGELLIVDNKAQTVHNVFNRNQEQKVNSQIHDILTGKQILKQYQTHSVSTMIETDRQQNPIFKQINDYDCQKWMLKSRYTMTKYQMNLSQIDQIKGFKSFDQYITALSTDFLTLILTQIQSGAHNTYKDKQQAPLTSRPNNLGGTVNMDQNRGLTSRDNTQFKKDMGHHNPQMHTQEDQPESQIFSNMRSTQFSQNKQIIIKKSTQKSIAANLWLSNTYPFDIEQFLPLIHVLAFCSKQIRQFNKFLLKYPLPKGCFPVEARIPLLMTMEAVFSFKNLELGFRDPSVFEVDKQVAVV